MDHIWDGFYTGQRRMTRFFATIQNGIPYTIEYTGTPPKNMRYKLLGATGDGIILRIKYAEAGSYELWTSGAKVEYNAWDQSIGAHGMVQKTTCGNNRYVGVDNFMEFYITPNCEIEIKPRNAVMARIRMEWTMEAIFSFS